MYIRLHRISAYQGLDYRDSAVLITCLDRSYLDLVLTSIGCSIVYYASIEVLLKIVDLWLMLVNIILL